MAKVLPEVHVSYACELSGFFDVSCGIYINSSLTAPGFFCGPGLSAKYAEKTGSGSNELNSMRRSSSLWTPCQGFAGKTIPTTLSRRRP